MLSWMTDASLVFASWLPAWLAAGDDSSRYVILQGMFALLTIVALVLLIALRPIRNLMAHYRARRTSPDKGN